MKKIMFLTALCSFLLVQAADNDLVEKLCVEKFKKEKLELEKTHKNELQALSEKYDNALKRIKEESQRGDLWKQGYHNLSKQLRAIQKDFKPAVQIIVKTLGIQAAPDEDITGKLTAKFEQLVNWHEYYKTQFEQIAKILEVTRAEQVVPAVKELKKMMNTIEREKASKQEVSG